MATSVNEWMTVCQYIFQFIFLFISFAATKILNGIMIGGGIAVAVGTGWYV
jgi:hypothetical protein